MRYLGSMSDRGFFNLDKVTDICFILNISLWSYMCIWADFYIFPDNTVFCNTLPNDGPFTDGAIGYICIWSDFSSFLDIGAPKQTGTGVDNDILFYNNIHPDICRINVMHRSPSAHMFFIYTFSHNLFRFLK